MKVNENLCFLNSIVQPEAEGRKIVDPQTPPPPPPNSPSMKLTLSRCNWLSLAGIFFATNCCQWLDPIHLHRSPLKRDADELNQSANYAHSWWGACRNGSFLGLFLRVHIPNCMHVHSCVCLRMCKSTQWGEGPNHQVINREKKHLTRMPLGGLLLL